jgi:trans-2,3-dihydro-3-hydroxyanthranilate isomerase
MSAKLAILVKSFTTDPSQGSAAGVIPDADDLTDRQMLHIAQTLGFPETAFVQASAKATYRSRFFSPRQEVPFCGHGTLAIFHVLQRLGRLPSKALAQTVTQETLAGLLPVTGHDDGLIVMTQRDPEFWEPETNRADTAALVGLGPTDLAGHPIQTVSTGTPKLIIPVKSLDALRRIQPDWDAMVAHDEVTGSRGFYPYTTETITPDADFSARQFNPIFDRHEDPITGVAAGALAAYITHHHLSPKHSFTIEQGFDLGKGGLMTASYGQHVQVGGHTVIYDELELDPGPA